MDDFIFYFKIGLFHVLDLKGYDHILFLIVLTVIYKLKEWKKILWVVSLFTIGHSVTLAMSSYGIIKIKADLIEFMIPLTIFTSGVMNVVNVQKNFNSKKENLNLFFSFFFGLIHGLGFSNYFKLIIGKSNAKLVHLSEFAIGIEAAQIIIVTSILLVGYLLQALLGVSRRDWILVSSSIVIGFSLQLMFNRVFW